jgi:hypothetical protein
MKNIDNYEISPLRFEMESIFEEYRSLRAEIITHLANQQQNLLITATLIAGVFAAFLLIKQTDYTSFVNTALLILSILFSSLSLMFFNEEIILSEIGLYINTILKPKLESLMFKVNERKIIIWEWQDFHSKNIFKSRLTISAYLINLGGFLLYIFPSLIIIIYYWSQSNSGSARSLLNDILFYIALSLLFAVIFSGIISISSFRRIYRSNIKK